MPSSSDHDQEITTASFLARDCAPDIDVVLLTHYPDAETLDTLRPGETDLQTARAVNHAVAMEMLEAGVELVVQRADKAAFRRWMADRDDTPENRRAWVDRGRLLRGPDALAALGLKPPPPPPGPVFGNAPGPIADALLEAFQDQDNDAFDRLVQDLMNAGRTDVLDLAIRKLSETEGDEAADDLNWVFLVAAEGAARGPSGWAELVALVAALPASNVPDGGALGQSLIGSGALPETDELILLPGWRAPAALADLSYAAIRRVLLDLIAGKPPQDLPPGDTDDLARTGFGVLLGLRIDWAIPIWEEIAAAGGLPDMPDADEAETPQDARLAALFDQWRGRVFQEGQGCVPLDLVAFSQVANEIADFLAEAGKQTSGIDEIRDFVAACRHKAGSGDIVCTAHITDEHVDLSVYSRSNQLVDSLHLPTGRLLIPADEILPLIGAMVTLVPNPPGT